MNYSLEVSNHVNDVLLEKVATHAWEKELVDKFQGSYINKKMLEYGKSVAINKDFDGKKDDKLLNKPAEKFKRHDDGMDFENVSY